MGLLSHSDAAFAEELRRRLAETQAMNRECERDCLTRILRDNKSGMIRALAERLANIGTVDFVTIINSIKYTNSLGIRGFEKLPGILSFQDELGIVRVIYTNVNNGEGIAALFFPHDFSGHVNAMWGITTDYEYSVVPRIQVPFTSAGYRFDPTVRNSETVTPVGLIAELLNDEIARPIGVLHYPVGDDIAAMNIFPNTQIQGLFDERVITSIENCITSGDMVISQQQWTE